LLDVISISDLLMADHKDEVNQAKDVIAIEANAEEADAAALMSRHKFMSLPVTDKKGLLIGVIPANDIVDRIGHQYAKAVSTDAETMGHLTPSRLGRVS
jgi:magnesium transporter